MISRELVIQQGASTVTRLVADGIRHRRSSPPPPSVAPADGPALREAEQLLAQHKAAQVGIDASAPPSTEGMFDAIEGHPGQVDILERAVRASRPTHVLLVGAPGTGKTEMLLRLRRLKGTMYATGASISTAGLYEFLQANPQGTILLIDDLDKAAPDDLWGLLQLMQTGSLTQLKAGKQRTLERKLRVFAAANSIEPLPEPLLSRFVVQPIPAYTLAQYRAVCVKTLTREGIAPGRARQIAEAVSQRSRDPRDAVKVAHLLRDDEPIGPVLDRVLPGKGAGESVS